MKFGLLADEATRLNGGFLQHHRTGRPLVTIKAAVSLDGMISARDGCSRWISGEPARRFAHRLRFGHDALLVGAGTVRSDDPRLTVRLDGPPAVCFGARVEVVAGGVTQYRWSGADVGFLGCHAPDLLFGLGTADRALVVRVRWADGRTTERAGVEPGTVVLRPTN